MAEVKPAESLINVGKKSIGVGERLLQVIEICLREQRVAAGQGTSPHTLQYWKRGCSQLEPHGSDVETYGREGIRRGELLIDSRKSSDHSEQPCPGMKPRIEGMKVPLRGLELSLRYLNHSEIRNHSSKPLC